MKDNTLEPIPLEESFIISIYDILLKEVIWLFNKEDNVYIIIIILIDQFIYNGKRIYLKLFMSIS